MIERWLPLLADPAGLVHDLPEGPVDPGPLSELVKSAAAHGVLPAVLQNLRQLQQATGRLASSDLAAVIDNSEQLLFNYTGVSMQLRAQASEIQETFRDRQIAGMVFKGPQFADRLYPSAWLRTFTDVDLLVSRNHLDAARTVLHELGYRQQDMHLKYADGYGETAWTRPAGSAGTVELHWSLVNSPVIRRRIDVRYEDLDFRQAQPSASSLLLIAAVHAAASHSFDRLGPLVDIQQAVRGHAGELDEDWLKQAIRKTGTAICMAPALQLAGRLLREPLCIELRHRLELTGCGSWSLALAPAMVMQRHTRFSALRRKLYREILKHS